MLPHVYVMHMLINLFDIHSFVTLSFVNLIKAPMSENLKEAEEKDIFPSPTNQTCKWQLLRKESSTEMEALVQDTEELGQVT